MASSNVPHGARRQLKVWMLELLPGLEEFLTHTLASEQLTPFAEERRQFFIERLDIVKLPPTLPPREGRVLPPELLKETEETSGVPATHTTPDFAATQREISRLRADPSPIPPGDEVDGADTSSDKGVKVYDDIEPTDSVKAEDVPKPRPVSGIIKPSENSDEDNEDENDLYEIPVARQQLPPEDNSLPHGADGSGLATAGSTEELADDVLDSTAMGPPPVPPPLPPRKDIRFSDSGSRNSVNGDVKPPELPFRPPLPKRNELYTRSDKSDRSERSANSDPEISAGEGGSTSYESFEEDNDQHDTDLMNKLNIKLPKKPKKKSALKKSKKLSKSRSSSQWEISVPFRKLDNINISGELYHKGKLSWNRRIVAISNGCLAMYKPDKEARPMLVIPLCGYEATVTERDGRKGYEVKMTHPLEDSHTFSVDFRDWANLWMEHINGTSRGQLPPKYHTHLARSLVGGGGSSAELGVNPATSGSKSSAACRNSREITFSEMEGGDLEDLFIKEEEEDNGSIKSSPADVSAPRPRKAKTLARHFQSEKSPGHARRGKTLDQSAKLPTAGGSPKDKTIGATVKDILRRRQRAMYRMLSADECTPVERYTLRESIADIQGTSPASKGTQGTQPASQGTQGTQPVSQGIQSCSQRRKAMEERTRQPPVRQGKQPGNQECQSGCSGGQKPKQPGCSGGQQLKQKACLKQQQCTAVATRPSSAVSMNRWNWRNVFYNWSALDQLMMAFRGTDLTGSNSNLSTGSEGAGSEDNTRPRIRGNKARMGSFAFRATQFFENIGKKTTSAKRKISGQNSHPGIFHSSSVGDYTDTCNGIVEESSLSSSNSMGNLPLSMLTPTSDNSLPSVFGDAHSSSSLPTTPMTDLDSPLGLLESKSEDGLMMEEHFADVAHRGYLLIFSSFNKRRWGKRWCLVRQNMFECYKTDHSRQCELNFLLRPCVFRRAVAETSSELGLMILEDGKEKITVEPLSKEDMGKWVRTLLSESSTPTVPEGLEDFMQDSEEDNTSVMSFSVLKQWDMGSLVPRKESNAHEYEDPQETLSTAAKLQPPVIIQCDPNSDSETDPHTVTISQSKLEDDQLNSEAMESTVVTQVSEGNEGNFPKIKDNLAAYNKHKHTTDSGFYSVKGANSDSDSSCENTARDLGEMDSGYATLDTRTNFPGIPPEVVDSVTESSTAEVLENSTSQKSPENKPLNCDPSSECVSSPSSQSVHTSHSTLSTPSSSNENKVVLSTSESHAGVTSHPSVSASTSQHRDSSQNTSSEALVPPQELSLTNQNPSTTSSSNSAAATITTPTGEEYSIVLKRSERSSKSPESTHDSHISKIESSEHEPSSPLHNSRKLEDNVFEEIFVGGEGDLREFAEDLANSITIQEESFYEPVGECNSAQEIPQTKMLSSPGDEQSNKQKGHLCQSGLNTGSMEAGQVSSGNPSTALSSDNSNAKLLPVSPRNDTDSTRPPAIPTTSVPHSSQTPALPSTNQQLARSASAAAKLGKKKGNRPAPLRPQSESSIVPPLSLSLCNGESASQRGRSLSPNTAAQKADIPVTPTTDMITALVQNPNTTEEQLNTFIERMKLKQSEIKRKRMAVHDKRQRAASDEERLACEKEIAALERTGEATEHDIRILQNQLDILQGQTLEAMKAAHGKNKGGSRKKKSKKKS